MNDLAAMKTERQHSAMNCFFSSIGSLLCICSGFSLSLLSYLCKVVSNEKNPKGLYMSILSANVPAY